MSHDTTNMLDPLSQPIWQAHPEVAKYLELKSALYELEFAANAEMIDPLHASLAALKDVFYFLSLDHQCAQFSLIRTVGTLLQAIHDTSQGAKPPLFFDSKRKTNDGAPKHTSESLLRGEMVLLLRLLINAGIKANAGSSWLAMELQSAGIRQKKSLRQPEGEAILPKQLQRWEIEFGAKSMAGSDEAFRTLKAGEADISGPPKVPEEAKARVRLRIRGLQAKGF